jgi:16S rRNA (guanine966-N2)-methyltransferase
MRVIAGQYRGLPIPQPKGGHVRPTTDRAKEGLFNILSHKIELEGCNVLDLFAGSGNISIEFASRGCPKVTAVEKNPQIVNQIKSFIEQRGIMNVRVITQDVFSFLMRKSGPFQIIFADPPYDLPRIPELIDLVLNSSLLASEGMLIIEHPSQLTLSHPSLQDTRKYGQSVFSFFSN